MRWLSSHSSTLTFATSMRLVALDPEVLCRPLSLMTSWLVYLLVFLRVYRLGDLRAYSCGVRAGFQCTSIKWGKNASRTELAVERWQVHPEAYDMRDDTLVQ